MTTFKTYLSEDKKLLCPIIRRADKIQFKKISSVIGDNKDLITALKHIALEKEWDGQTFKSIMELTAPDECFDGSLNSLEVVKEFRSADIAVIMHFRSNDRLHTIVDDDTHVARGFNIFSYLDNPFFLKVYKDLYSIQCVNGKYLIYQRSDIWGTVSKLKHNINILRELINKKVKNIGSYDLFSDFVLALVVFK